MPRNAATKPRGGNFSPSKARRDSSGILRLASSISSRLRATIFLRMSGVSFITCPLRNNSCFKACRSPCRGLWRDVRGQGWPRPSAQGCACSGPARDPGKGDHAQSKLWVRITSRSSRLRASPLAMAARAFSIPSFRSPAKPAV